MIVQVIVVGLATWRVASLLVAERGPYAVFERLREAVGIRRNTELSELAKLFSCVWCLSPWLIVPLWFVYYVAPWLPGILAAATIVILADRWSRP